MKLFHSEKYTLPLPEKHRFPMDKYKLLREKIISENLISNDHIHEATLASKDDVLLAHTEKYVTGIQNGSMDQKDFKRIGFPWSEMLYLRSLSSVGGFLGAVETAFEYGVGGNLSGGTHHAHADRGEGFCVFNDFAIAARKLIKDNKASRVVIIDLDVHQGNGNSSILKDDSDIFVFSMHGKKNYPFKKVSSDLDIELDDGVGDDEYLSLLEQSIKRLPPSDIILYQAGVDILEYDSLGTLNISKDGVLERDRMIFELAKDWSVPIAIALGGGYSKPIEHTVEAHFNTYQLARNFF